MTADTPVEPNQPSRRMPRSLAAFEGRWTLVRTIRHADGLEGRLEGTVTFTPAGPGRLVYDEDGVLTLGASEPLHATRRYLWREAGRQIEIAFADGRPFHALNLLAPAPSTVYLCDPDRYAVSYDFSAWPTWEATWQVEGPRKDYTMVSHYTIVR